MKIDGKLTRRELVALGVTSGFALAVAPGMGWAATVTTSGDGLVAGEVSIPVKGGKMPGYRAVPKGKGNHPVVLVIHEIFGVHAYVQDVCRRLAKEGYSAVAPYLFFRQGDVTQMTDTGKILSDVVSKVPQGQVWSDLDATLAWSEKTRQGEAKRASIVGFCWGGNVAWTYSAHNPKLKAGVAWYGRLANRDSADTVTKSPLDLARELKIPVLGLYGAKDAGIPLDTVDKMRAALAKGKSGSEIVVYPEAGHAFHADYRPSYHEVSAKDGWKRLLAWLRNHGAAADADQ